MRDAARPRAATGKRQTKRAGAGGGGRDGSGPPRRRHGRELRRPPADGVTPTAARVRGEIECCQRAVDGKRLCTK